MIERKDNMTTAGFLREHIDVAFERGKFDDHPVQTPWPLVDEIVNQIDIMDSVLVLYNPEFVWSLHEHGWDLASITLFANCESKKKWANKIGIKYITDLEGLDMKFDVVVGNPPYVGKAALHQQFFVKACDLLKDGGEMMFIQPAIPYISNKDNRKKKPEVKMLELVEEYEARVNIITENVFDNARLATDLAITHLTKTPGSTSIQYDGGHTYKDITVNEINALAIEPKVFVNLKSKFTKLVESRGSVEDVVHCGEDQLKLRLQKIRGPNGKNYTFISRDPKFWDSTSDFGVPLKHEGQRLNVASYLKTYVARFALAILKMNVNHHMGELVLVPLVDFDQSWDDEKLCKEFGITDDEYAVIRSVIPTYYEDVQ
jgi:hypothetical protein